LDQITTLLSRKRVIFFEAQLRYLAAEVIQFTSLPRFDLLSHRLEVPLHSVNAN